MCLYLGITTTKRHTKKGGNKKKNNVFGLLRCVKTPFIIKRGSKLLRGCYKASQIKVSKRCKDLERDSQEEICEIVKRKLLAGGNTQSVSVATGQYVVLHTGQDFPPISCC